MKLLILIVSQEQQPSGVLVEQKMNDLLFFSPDRLGIKSNRVTSSSARNLGSQYTRRLEAASSQVAISESSSKNPCLSALSPSTAYRKKGGNHLVATTSIQSDRSSAPLEIIIPNSGKTDGAENLNM